MRDLILQLSKSSIYSTKPLTGCRHNIEGEVNIPNGTDICRYRHRRSREQQIRCYKRMNIFHPAYSTSIRIVAIPSYFPAFGTLPVVLIG
ncbi:hypothetical protein AM451_14465 [Enterobacter cloacae complex sp.]|nr:hypothetical protein AM451_14465 [Enterobacter cloacae complex sp.]